MKDKLEILYNNNQLIAVNKPAGVPVQADLSKDESLQEWVSKYCKHPVYLVNRIDRPVSGIVLFAKNTRAMTALSKQFQLGAVVKKYLAVVENMPENAEGERIQYIYKDRNNKSKIVEASAKDAQKAELYYKHLRSTDNYHILEIELRTGRHHQIRCQLADMNCPIKGDVKYGARRANKDKSIELHAWKLSFSHPVTGEKEEVLAPLPKSALWDIVLA